MEQWLAEIEFERQGALRRLVKSVLINPLANYAPTGMVKALLRLGDSKLAAANWSDPGGWESMVISYHGHPRQIADKMLVSAGTMPMALRNRKKLGSRMIAQLIDSSENTPAHVLCLGAGPGQIIMDAMQQASKDSFATLVDISTEAFDFGRSQAERFGLSEKVRFIESDVRHVQKWLDRPPDVVKMLGICEYLSDDHVVEIASAAAEVMPPGTSIVFNSLSRAHGNERFFRRVFGLHMIHRSPAHLQELMRKAGFREFKAFAEPLGVYHVIVAHRADGPPPATSEEGS